MSLHWNHTQTIQSKSYTCGYCGNPLASNIGLHEAVNADGSGGTVGELRICHHCFKPTYFDNRNGTQTPGVRPGEDVAGIDDAGVAALYNEARDTYSKNAFTATILCCRKLLMHIAVTKGADEGQSFLSYVEYLSEKNYVPPDAKSWVDHIRTKGNEANHEIVLMSKEDADDLIAFITMLLKLIYEFPSKMKSSQVA